MAHDLIDAELDRIARDIAVATGIGFEEARQRLRAFAAEPIVPRPLAIAPRRSLARQLVRRLGGFLAGLGFARAGFVLVFLSDEGAR